MEVYEACNLSTVRQAIYTDPYNVIYLAITSKYGISFMRRKPNKSWENGHPWTRIERDRGGNKWLPVAPEKKKK